jgi:hypothetical protein
MTTTTTTTMMVVMVMRLALHDQTSTRSFQAPTVGGDLLRVLCRAKPPRRGLKKKGHSNPNSNEISVV